MLGFLCLILLLSSCGEWRKENAIHLDQEGIDYQKISAELEVLQDEDQRYKARFTEMIINKEPFDNKFVKEMNVLVSISKVRMIDILGQNGWISKDHICEKAFDATFLVI